MENEVKQRNQRNRRRERAQRMQAQRESKVKDGDSGEDESPAREKPPRPPARRKKSREPLGEEDIIDGFAIMAFRTYEDLEAAVKCASSPRTNALTNKPRPPLAALAGDPTRNHPPNNVNSHAITLLQDAGTSDDSGRASERLTGSSVAPRDPDSSRDRLSDASSRCSSGKGYICDSEGDDEKASPDNSRNASPRYHDASMDDASDAGSLFRVTGAGVGGGAKNELVARGGSGGALALSRAPVGGSASPAPAPLPQPAPSPAPAALPPPALPAPPFRADAPHRPKGAHIPAIDAHAATQIPTRGPDTPERPAPNNKLPPGARAAADSPTPAPPAPPAPSPLFPSHAAYQPHPAAALPDYRHTNHETRTEPPQPAAPPPAPLDLHAQHAPRPPAPTAPPPRLPPPSSLSASIPSVPAPLPHRLPVSTPHSQPSSIPPCLPSQAVSGRPQSPTALVSRPYPAPTIGSSHTNSSVSSSIHNHAIPYQSQPSIQKHSVQSVYANRPPHLAPFGVPNHVSANHLPPPSASLSNPTLPIHPMSNHSIANHASHLPPSGQTSTASHAAPVPISTTTTTMSSYPSSVKHPGLSIPSHGALVSTPVSHASMNHVDASLTSAGSASAAASNAAEPAPSSLPGSGYPPPAVFPPGSYPPLYAPYATTLQHSPYLPPAAASPRNSADTRTSLSASPLVAPKTPKGVRPHTPGSTGAAGSVHAPHSYSPRTQSPSRDRDFSISSLSRSTPASVAVSSVSAPSLAPTLSAPLAGPLVAPLGGGLSSGLGAPLTAPLATPTPTQAPTPSSHLTHSLAPVPTIPSISSSAKPPAHWGVTRASGTDRGAGFAPPLFSAPLAPPNPNPFSAESLFQTSPSADLLRRELDSRFLAAATRTELHHHQHQHTHVHQHPPHHPHHPHHLLFKDMSKMPSLYRAGLGLGYPYSSGLLPPPAPYVPPAPLASYAPKPVVSAASDPASKPPPRPAVTKTGKWNAMHVRIAWEIYNHQQKEKSNGGVVASGVPGDKDKLRAFPSPAPPPPAAYRSPYELSAPYLHPAPLAAVRAAGYPPALPPSDRNMRVAGVSPFARYGAGPFPPTQPFPLAAYGRELALASPLHPPPLLHDAWRMRPAAPSAAPPVSAAAAAAGEQVRRDLEERERARRERDLRDERERREREERERRRQRDREMERARTRSPLRNGVPDPTKEERKEAPRPPPSLPPYPPPPWDPYRTFDPLQHMRFAPLVEAAIRAEEDRAKMLSAYAHHQQLKSSAMLRPLPPLHAPLAPLAPPLAPLAPLDLLKKEEPR